MTIEQTPERKTRKPSSPSFLGDAKKLAEMFRRYPSDEKREALIAAAKAELEG